MLQKAISTVQNNAKQEIEIQLKSFKPWVETSIWTERMLTALVNGVNGGRWHSLSDKVYRKRTLEIAWQQVGTNKGAAGIDQITIDKFKAKADVYLTELVEDLRWGKYKPQSVKRVHIPKDNGKMRPARYTNGKRPYCPDCFENGD